MKNLLSIILTILCVCQMNAQVIVDESKNWSTVIHRLPSFTIITENIKFEGDTTIENTDYKKVRRSIDEFQEIWEAYGFIRETPEKRVYFRPDSSEQDYLLYDFNSELNDIIEVYGISGYGNNNWLTPMNFFISEIDSILIGNQYRKQLHLNPVFGDTLPEASEFWIEGIGSKSGILHWNAALTGGDSHQLLCHWQNDTLIFQNPLFSSCYYVWTNKNEIVNDKQVNIYPNPMSQFAKIEINNYDLNSVYILEVFDLQGKKVFEDKLGEDFTLDLKNFNSGIYIFKIICNGITLKSEKLIIK